MARWDNRPNRKVRASEVLTLRFEHPDWSYREIVAALGNRISPQRAHQIIREATQRMAPRKRQEAGNGPG